MIQAFFFLEFGMVFGYQGHLYGVLFHSLDQLEMIILA